MRLRPVIYPLRHHLFFLVLGALIPMVAFSLVIVYQLAAYERAVAEHRLDQATADLAGTIDREFNTSLHALQILAQSASLQEGQLGNFRVEAERVLRVQPSWQAVILTDGEGKALVNTMYSERQPLPPLVEMGSFRTAVASGGPVVGTLQRGPRHRLAFPIRLPVLEEKPVVGEKKVRYVITAVIDAGSISELLRAQSHPDDEWTRTLVDTAGTVVARTRNAEQFVGKPASPSFVARTRSARSGIFANISLDGQRVYVVYRRTTIGGWIASIVVPRSMLDSALNRSIASVAAIGVLILLFSVAGAFLLSRLVGRGITAAADAAETLASGGKPEVPASTISEVTRLSDSLRRSADLLQRREQERNDLLQQAQLARQQAEGASQAKDEFLAMLGHELRNPLGPIRTGMHLLSTLPPTDPRYEATRQTIERQVHHMSRLVDDLLDASRIVRGKFQLQRDLLDLRELAGAVATDMASHFQHATFRVQMPAGEVYVHGDRTRLAQAIGNLLHNAAKFTPAGGTIAMELQEEAGEARLSVRDSGAGIDPALLPDLFKPFSQGAQPLGRPLGGLGLGLSLVKGFVELHGGRVWAESAGRNRGSTFTISLPTTADRPIEIRQEQPGPAAGERGGRRVMIVEDMKDAARTLALLLSLDGHQVQIANSSGEALVMARRFLPEVVICDIGLPDMDGYALCGRLKEMPELHWTRMIALTGYGQMEDVARARKAGFHLHLTKPVDIPRLREALALREMGEAGEAARGWVEPAVQREEESGMPPL